MPISTVLCVGESEVVGGVSPVSDGVLDGLADVLVDRIDQLSDRLTDRALAAPVPGSRVWESAWNERDTAVGHARSAERSRVRAELTYRAVTELCSKHPCALGVPTRRGPSARSSRASSGRGRVDDAQLAFF